MHYRITCNSKFSRRSITKTGGYCRNIHMVEFIESSYSTRSPASYIETDVVLDSAIMAYISKFDRAQRMTIIGVVINSKTYVLTRSNLNCYIMREANIDEANIINAAVGEFVDNI